VIGYEDEIVSGSSSGSPPGFMESANAGLRVLMRDMRRVREASDAIRQTYRKWSRYWLDRDVQWATMLYLNRDALAQPVLADDA
jgi:hypothetical protein